MKTYNLTEYSDALFISKTSRELNHGVEMLIWATDVIRFFKSIYDAARSFAGHWSARIKLAWAIALQRQAKANESVVIGKLKGIRHNGVIYLSSGKNKSSYVMKGAKKHRNFCY